MTPCILPIEHIFNFSLMHGVFLVRWKSGMVCHIPKVRNPAAVNNCRPISIFLALSKMMERIVRGQICSFLERFDLFDSRQSVYRRTYFTQTCLISTFDDIRYVADQRRVNFSKAFDRVIYGILIEKFRYAPL